MTNTFIATLFLLNAINLTSLDSHQHEELKNKSAPAGIAATTYSCRLIAHSQLCRQYSIANTAEATVKELREGCESMANGKFQAVACPTTPLAGRCLDIVRDYHRPDVIYDNYYYADDKKSWPTEELKRVCKNLGGEFIEATPENKK